MSRTDKARGNAATRAEEVEIVSDGGFRLERRPSLGYGISTHGETGTQDLARALASSGMPTPSISDFGARLRALRRARQLTGADLAKLTGLNASKISKLETGERPPRPNDATAIAQGLDLSDDESRDLVRLAEEEALQRPRSGITRLVRTQEHLLRCNQQSPEVWQYEATWVPSPLQTPEYSEWLLANRGVTGTELSMLLAIRSQRAGLLFKTCEGANGTAGAREYRFLLSRTLLDNLRRPPVLTPTIDTRSGEQLAAILPAQLSRIRDLVANYTNINARVLDPGLAPLLAMPVGFTAFGSHLVTVETTEGVEMIGGSDRVAVYREAFDKAWTSIGPASDLGIELTRDGSEILT